MVHKIVDNKLMNHYAYLTKVYHGDYEAARPCRLSFF